MADAVLKRPDAAYAPLPAACCLILMFLGAWTCDYAMLALAPLPEGYLSIRLLSLTAYLLAFLVACAALRGSERADTHRSRVLRALIVALALGAACLVAGSAGLVVCSSSGKGPLMAFVFLVKCVGPPLTIATLLLFAAMPPVRAGKTAALGMAGAFFIEYLMRAVMEGAAVPGAAALALGVICQAGGCIIAVILVRRMQAELAMGNEGALQNASTAAAATAHQQDDESQTFPVALWSRRGELAKALLCIAATGLMLGYLRTGASPGNSIGSAAALIVLVAVAAAVRCLPVLGTRSLFEAAVVCVCAAFLLGPVIDLAAPGASSVLADVGTILFEILIWLISLDIVRTRHRQLRAAAGARLVAVFGHLAGALVAAGAAAATASHPQAFQAASLAIVFVYVVILLVFSRGSSPASEAAEDANNAAEDNGSVGGPSATDGTAPAGAHAAAALAVEADYWEVPCRTIAESFSLTPRETEVLEQLAQGRDLAFMEEKFVLSRNTVKMHVRNIYAKLGVHSKQEVIDLVDQTRRG
ncbi:LuxR C-terminal-related transcriptional regulator [Adlercreutzia sp. R25]|uniref:LuxR C-terminal-related transcriptional regulator n=1 Tax=Adlercreutzia shanghongiae TaxID=3111773 RepID=A0ABU6IV97_9ACTN|nr:MULTISPECIES: LuxR C-terminal-related transcriptional regulator [unclassified Adlercreutzia]MEC4272020.1 LuxR C-terminal-related transcriptional regulator [Adlercreutzia sp. R25]MEC4293751.1 LuxR C-terminal-related transcriptional regulator [Adlercreutzia sp. R22]